MACHNTEIRTLGLDQANLRLARNLAGCGEVEVALTVDGATANRVRESFR